MLMATDVSVFTPGGLDSGFSGAFLLLAPAPNEATAQTSVSTQSARGCFCPEVKAMAGKAGRSQTSSWEGLRMAVMPRKIS